MNGWWHFMIKFDYGFQSMIQTQHGIIPINYIEIGDKVYSYESGKELEVLGVSHRDEDIYEIEYNDGRISYNTGRELKYLDKLVLYQRYIDYGKKITNPLYPDPYITGALLIYGDVNDPYLNLPSDCIEVNNLFAHKYQLTYGGTISAEGKSYFRYIGDGINKLITWEKFFENYTFSANQETYEDPPLIPLEYQRASITDRLKFIRGVFDVGYNKSIFVGNCGITHTSEEKLLEVQKILWSLGILSSMSDNDGYQLHVLGKHSMYPGHFYDIDSIEDLIKNEYAEHKYLKFKLQIKSVKFLTRIRTSDILLHKANMAYLQENFLPKISGHRCI